jgi:hypothetical protein
MRLLWLSAALALGGCLAAAAAATYAPLGLSAVKALGASAGSNMSGKGDNFDEAEQGARCDQLVQSPPYVAEVRAERDGTLVLRQWAIETSEGEQHWSVVGGKDADGAGWRSESIASANFDPPLAKMLSARGRNYLISVPAETLNIGDSDRQISAVGAFGASAGSYQWNGRRYRYTIAKSLPCFAIRS